MNSNDIDWTKEINDRFYDTQLECGFGPTVIIDRSTGDIIP